MASRKQSKALAGAIRARYGVDAIPVEQGRKFELEPET